MIVNLNELTQEQIWGIQYAKQLANNLIVAENERIENYNATNDPNLPLLDLLTDQTYIDGVVTKACDSYYNQLVSAKEAMALTLFRQLNPTEQQALLEQLQVPDVIE
jgi:hypothetical protein